jgi:hypothetical protein
MILLYDIFHRLSLFIYTVSAKKGHPNIVLALINGNVDDRTNGVRALIIIIYDMIILYNTI